MGFKVPFYIVYWRKRVIAPILNGKWPGVADLLSGVFFVG